MKRIALPLLLALLSVSMAVPACGWWGKHVDPVVKPLVICTGETIPLALVTQVYNDVMSDNWIDLATNVVPLLKDGWADVECIFTYLGKSNPEALPHIQKLKAQHASDFRGATSMRSPSQKRSPPGSAPRAPGGRSVVIAAAFAR